MKPIGSLGVVLIGQFCDDETSAVTEGTNGIERPI